MIIFQSCFSLRNSKFAKLFLAEQLLARAIDDRGGLAKVEG
jgi:hypothetical protein